MGLLVVIDIVGVGIFGFGLGASFSPSRCHLFLFFAMSTSSSKVPAAGASMNRSPGFLFANCTFAAIFTKRSLFIRRMCPSHTNRRCLTSATRSYVLVVLLASCLDVLPVILDMHRAFVPFIFAMVSGVKCHASLPYINREVTPVRYTSIFITMLSVLLLKTWRRRPHLAVARLERLTTSCMWSPSAEKLNQGI